MQLGQVFFSDVDAQNGNSHSNVRGIDESLLPRRTVAHARLHSSARLADFSNCLFKTRAPYFLHQHPAREIRFVNRNYFLGK